jgi:O-antigen ligase
MANIALFICLGLVSCLLRQESKHKDRGSAGAWVALVWIMVGASRPVSEWFSGSSVGSSSEAYDSGNAFERNLYLLLILVVLFMHHQRGTDFRSFFFHNRHLLLITLYCGLSVVWSDDPVVSLKRWIKECGTILVVLLILTEKNPEVAFKAVFVRCAYVLIPFSLLLIRYYSNLGRSYDSWEGDAMFIGVTTHKSSLGVLAMTATLALLWDLRQRLAHNRQTVSKIELMGEAFVLLVSIYILKISHSATSQVCTAIGIALFLILRWIISKGIARTLAVYAAITVIAILTLNGLFDLKAHALNFLGKDPTLTTRTETWPILLQLQDSPILGPGFKSFWSGERLEILLQKYKIIQAHNGYLETYLNLGIAGVLLLGVFLIGGWRSIRQDLLLGTDRARVRLVCWVISLFHNYTEATFHTFSPVWIILLISSINTVQTRAAARTVQKFLDDDEIGFLQQTGISTHC